MGKNLLWNWQKSLGEELPFPHETIYSAINHDKNDLLVLNDRNLYDFYNN